MCIESNWLNCVELVFDVITFNLRSIHQPARTHTTLTCVCMCVCVAFALWIGVVKDYMEVSTAHACATKFAFRKKKKII